MGTLSNDEHKQESPPTRTQEAYCPPCSKYSLCCPILAESPPPPGWTWPHPPLPAGPDNPPGWTWPPPPPLAGPDPPRLELSPPPASWTWPPTIWTWPPLLTGPDPPPPAESADWPPPPAGWTWSPPAESADWPPPCGKTDRHESKYNLPVVLRTRAVTTERSRNLLKDLQIWQICQKCVSWKTSLNTFNPL